jgi:GNAT superfamily N-acetyltransferase
MIREPTPTDVSEILGLARRFHAESYFRTIPLSERKIVDLLAASAQWDARVFTRVSEGSAGLDGIAMGHLAPYWFSEEVGAFDLCLFVVPERRGGTLAVRLWRVFRGWAEARGAVDLTHGVSSGINIENAHRFFTGMGMTHVGGLYKLGLKASRPNSATSEALRSSGPPAEPRIDA